jgi:hypothetical protein
VRVRRARVADDALQDDEARLRGHGFPDRPEYSQRVVVVPVVQNPPVWKSTSELG